MNPFISFCLYVAARVFVQYLKSRPKDAQVRASLQFLLQAMQAIKRKNPLTESFLVQLDVDLEGAGIEDIKGLRTQTQGKFPFAPTRSEGCPMEQLHMNHRPTYGDIGLAVYNNPSTSVPLTNTAPSQPGQFGYANLSDMTDESMGFIPSSNQFELPSRQRSPGSTNNSTGMHRSPQSFNPEMDMSPDGSSGEHRTPNSSAQSQQNMSTHTSNTGYSPQNLQPDQASSGIQPSPGRLTGLFDPNDNSFSTDFDMHSFPAATGDNQQQGFVLPSGWGAGSTGLTPGPTGFTPGASGMGDMMGMTDADWNQMMENMNYTGWETGVEHTEVIGPAATGMQGRRM